MKITQGKTDKPLYLPCTANLKAALDAAPKNGLTILTLRDGRPLPYRRMAASGPTFLTSLPMLFGRSPSSISLRANWFTRLRGSPVTYETTSTVSLTVRTPCLETASR